MASASSAARRMQTNTTVAKILAAASTGIVADSLPKVAKTVLKGSTGIVGDILLNPSEANAMDDVTEMKKWKPKK